MDHEDGGPEGRQGGPGCGGKGGGPGGGGRGGDEPAQRLDFSAAAWKGAFDEALHELRVELIKKEIRALWGGQLEATARGAAQAMHADWKKYWTEHKSELEAEAVDPERRIREIIREEIKKGLGG